MTRLKFSVYVHWPYCSTKCSYCAFNKYLIPEGGMQHDRMESSMIADLSFDLNRLNLGKSRILNSVFFGGGTPSLARPVLISKVLDQLKDYKTDQTEVTLEVNPNSNLTFDALKEFKEAGINRLSMGFQSLQNSTLKEFNRDHTVETALKSLKIAQSLFDNISLDFIYCRHNQTPDEWRLELLDILRLKVPHLTLYQLMIERGTKFFNSGLQVPTECDSATMYEDTIKVFLQKSLDYRIVQTWDISSMKFQHFLFLINTSLNII